MAHLKKNTRGSVKGLSIHFERKTNNHSNEEINVYIMLLFLLPLTKKNKEKKYLQKKS